MKRTMSLLLACTLGLGLLSGCAQSSAARELTASKLSASPSDSEEVNGALAAFGLALLQKTREADKTSTLVSPLSVALALSMAANGADGNTLAQFEEVLGGGTDLIELNGACVQLIQDYQGLGGFTKCTIANSLWADPEGQIKDEFVGKCRGIFDAQAFAAQLSDPAIVKELNRWVSKHTNKMIPSIIDQPFDENTALLLVNALYLKNKWLHQFSPHATHERDFYHADGSGSRMDFLSMSSTELSYIQDKGAQGVVLPYDDGRLAFVAIMPDLHPDSPDLGEWLNNLEGNTLAQLLNSREDALFLHFAMPKFTSEWKGNLEKILPALGLEDAFVPGTANFAKMGDKPDGYYISQVIHATKIEVNEKGAKAAAATVVAASGGSMPPQEGVTLVLDRPFLYGIVDLDTGVPLFLGTYE
ncbi:serine protease [Colidextribacter sp. OB.20]|uniref:serpin family protein n=1 Tax=Colidextribacter sp. OB.20 TaxID=2304568 RepID=UPI0013713923|nr:serpin family protein [Colidextribacter sp. OB.20]NBI08890.1 serine protease [Colidextribacter sp. OB.20]